MNNVILYEYDTVLLGEKTSLSPYFFNKSNEQNEKLALEVIRYAVENYLKWSPAEMYQRFDEDVVKLMKLESIMKYVCFPPEADEKKDFFVIAGKLYPDKVKIDIKNMTLHIYKKVLAGKMYKFPKGFFDGGLGVYRAAVCLQYALTQKFHFDSIEEIYRAFSTARGTKILKDSKLQAARIVLYDYAIDYLHDSLSEEDQDEFLYHQYRFNIINEKQKRRMLEKGTFIA